MSTYGLCPICFLPVTARDPNHTDGDSICEDGHVFPTKSTITDAAFEEKVACVELALLISQMAFEAKYDPSQPRDANGQFAGVGGGGMTGSYMATLESSLRANVPASAQGSLVPGRDTFSAQMRRDSIAGGGGAEPKKPDLQSSLRRHEKLRDERLKVAKTEKERRRAWAKYVGATGSITARHNDPD